MKHVLVGMNVKIKGRVGIVREIIDGRLDPSLDPTLYYRIEVTFPAKHVGEFETVRMDKIRRAVCPKSATPKK